MAEHRNETSIGHDLITSLNCTVHYHGSVSSCAIEGNRRLLKEGLLLCTDDQLTSLHEDLIRLHVDVNRVGIIVREGEPSIDLEHIENRGFLQVQNHVPARKNFNVFTLFR